MERKNKLTEIIRKEIKKHKQDFISKEKRDFEEMSEIIKNEYDGEYSYIIPDIISGKFQQFFERYIYNSVPSDKIKSIFTAEDYAKAIEEACIKHISENKEQQVLVNGKHYIFNGVYIETSTKAFELYKTWDIILSKVVMELNSIELSHLKLQAMLNG